MGDVHPRDGFTIGQLLRALREQVVSVLFVVYSSPLTAPADTPPARTNLWI